MMHQYTGANDGMSCSIDEMTKEMAAKRLRPLMKIPQK
jgi:hypothetical protein